MKLEGFDFTIGADPEFCCLDGRGRMITSTHYVGNSEEEDFGSDGNGVTFELRPAPSNNPLEIVHNIHDIFIRKVLQDPQFLKFEWKAGSFHKGYPFGGHIHFGINSNQVNFTDAIYNLDSYCGIVSLLLEKRSEGQARRKDSYGKMGDMRTQPWGFEYRPMSSWLSSPYVASAMLCLGKTVMYEMMNNKEFEWHHLAKPEDFVTVDQKRLRTVFPQVWKDITKMRLYQHYKPYLDLIYFLVTNRLSWLPTTDMKSQWGIVDMKRCISQKINVDMIWGRYAEETTNIIAS